MEYTGQLRVVKRGASLLLRLDKTAREELDLKDGDIVNITIRKEA